MKKTLCVILFVALFFAMLASAQAISIVLTSPADKTTITDYAQSFIFGFDQLPSEIVKCSLIINGEIMGIRDSLISMNNNKITLGLVNGNYTWLVNCIDSGSKETNSETRSFTINIPAPEIKEGYEIFYNMNGLRSYLITIAPGQKPVTLPAMKGGEDIRIKLAGKIYYLDILRMGVNLNDTFVDIKDRSTGKTYRMLVPSTQSFDFNNDKTMDIELSLKNVERTVNAYFVVTPYPSTAQPVTPPAENPTPPVVQPETPPAETQPAEQPSQETPEETPQTSSTGPESTSESERGETSNTWFIPAIIAVAIVIILIIALSSFKGKKPGKKNTPEKKAKKDTKKEMPEPEQQPMSQEKFDIIKSTGRKR